ncbi:MAG: tryptophan-rich sensory protein [Clostridia bacterium]|nr:tryptophan-rich sensory protein [Clostridia bacterium]
MSFWKKYKPIIIQLALTLALAGLGVLLSGDYSTLYTRLEKPPLAPPGWLFPVAWSILYVLMGVAAGLVARSNDPRRQTALRYYYIQLIINILWPVIFFRFELLSVALVWLAVLIVAVLLTWRRFREISVPAGWLLVPYLAWCLFAFYLNAGIVVLN